MDEILGQGLNEDSVGGAILIRLTDVVAQKNTEECCKWKYADKGTGQA